MSPSDKCPKRESHERQSIRVLIADDHPLVRAGLYYSLASEPDLSVVAEATSGDEVQRLCQECQPDVLVLDLRMPGSPALETMAYVRQHCPETKVLMLTAYDDEAHERGLVEAGASGYLLKEEAPATVSDAIRAVARGATWFSQSVAEKLAHPTEFSELTPRERQVLKLVAQGNTNQQVSQMLQTAEVTVRFHLRNIYSKIGVESRAQAVRWAMQHGLEG